MYEKSPDFLESAEEADILVPMNDWGEAKGRETIATLGLGPCMGVAVYEAASSHGFLAHSVGMETMIFQEMLAHVRAAVNNTAELTAWVTGGSPATDPGQEDYRQAQLKKLLALIKATGISEAHTVVDWITDPEVAVDIMLDCATGICTSAKYNIHDLEL